MAGDIGANYTLSRNRGNVGALEGETVANGPVRFDHRFPEYKQASWNFPDGDLPTDQRHRSRLWLNFRLDGTPRLRDTEKNDLGASVSRRYVGVNCATDRIKRWRIASLSSPATGSGPRSSRKRPGS